LDGAGTWVGISKKKRRLKIDDGDDDAEEEEKEHAMHKWKKEYQGTIIVCDTGKKIEEEEVCFVRHNC
jgi:hypothetical protein